MSTIEALLKDWDKYPASRWASDAITEPWNAGLAAMKAYVQNNFHITKKGVWHCSQCRGSSDDFHSWHIPGKCHVATQQAAIAAMEGDLTPDENVVESG